MNRGTPPSADPNREQNSWRKREGGQPKPDVINADEATREESARETPDGRPDRRMGEGEASAVSLPLEEAGIRTGSSSERRYSE